MVDKTGQYNRPSQQGGINKIFDNAPRHEMEQLANGEDILQFIAAYSEELLIFGVDRTKAFSRFDGIPEFLIKGKEQYYQKFKGNANPGEFYTFQLGVYNGGSSIASPVQLDIDSDCKWLKDSFGCFNTGGINLNGTPFSKQLSIAPGRLQPLWCSILIPENACGAFTAKIVVNCGGKCFSVTIDIEVSGKIVANCGDDDETRFSRLRWLNSTIGQDDNFISQPYERVQRHDRTLKLLGKEFEIGEHGLPEQVTSYFNSGNTDIIEQPTEVLSKAFEFIVETETGIINLQETTVKILQETPVGVKWHAISNAENLKLECFGELDYDSGMIYKTQIESANDIKVKDIRLEINVTPKASKYFVGLGQKGGICPQKLEWQWNEEFAQDGFWIGAVNAGFRIRFKGANYRSPLYNAYYHQHELIVPESWGNNGKGGIKLSKKSDNQTHIIVYSGKRKLKNGEKLYFDFDINLTPFKPIDSKKHWSRRFYQKFIHDLEIDENPMGISPIKAKKSGVTHINIHHATGPNPIINYPFSKLSMKGLKNYVDDCHNQDIKVGLYYTTREVTVNLPEFWALLSLNGEIIFPGAGPDSKPITNPEGPHQWLNEHVRENFIPAWHEPVRGEWGGILDLSVLTSPDSRWDNFYLEGLDYTLRHTGFDGLYLDETTLTRKSFQRMRKILYDNKVEGYIDFHAWNPYNELAGMTSVVHRDMDVFAHLDDIWIGEGMRYNEEDFNYWLVEISGIPFGLMSEMLQDGGNPWRGLLFGMTCRLGWLGDPRNIWQLWDEFVIADSDLLGFWDEKCPVKTNSCEVPVTVYKKNNQALIVAANWADCECKINFNVNWEKLGMKKNSVRTSLCSIANLQDAGGFNLDQSVSISPLDGIVVLVENHK